MTAPSVWERLEERCRLLDEQAARADVDPAGHERRLQARARALRAAPPGAASERRWEVLAFRIGTERYAIRVTACRAVHALQQYSMAPGAPPWVHGVAPLRGEILSLVDLGVLIGTPRKGLADLRRAIEVGEADHRFALLATEVEDIRAVSDAALAPAPHAGGRRGRCVEGVLEGDRVLIDADELTRDVEGGRP